MNIPTLYAPKAFEVAYSAMHNHLIQRLLDGGHYQDGEVIRFGWMWFKIVDEGDDDLQLQAPVLGSIPMQFVPDCSEALNLVMSQRLMVTSFNHEPEWCHARQMALVVRDIADCRQICMDRLSPGDEMDSGWYFGASDSPLDVNDPANLVQMSLWELAKRYPPAIDFFLLASGWQVMLLPEGPQVLYEFEPVEYGRNTHYAKKYAS